MIPLNSCREARAKTEDPRVPVEGSLHDDTVQESRMEEEQDQCRQTAL